MAMVTLGIIGLGKWAEVLTRASLQSDQLKIIKAFSRSEETRNKYQAAFSIPCVADVAGVLSDPAVQGVILTVPNELHFHYAALCAQAGKHVYIEKPIANTIEDSRKILQVCDEHKVNVFVGHCAKLLSGVQKIKAAIDRGDLGDVCLLEGTFANERALKLTPNDWRWYQEKAPGGPLSQIAIHQFDVLRYLGGPILGVSALSTKKSPVGAEVEDQWVVSLAFASGAIGAVKTSWTSPGVFEVRVIGTKAIMHYQIDQTKWGTAGRLHEGASLTIQRHGQAQTQAESIPVDPTDMFQMELELFAQMIGGVAQPNFSGSYGLEILGLVEAARQSAAMDSRRVAL
jgi:predicted dehydrogenase